MLQSSEHRDVSHEKAVANEEANVVILGSERRVLEALRETLADRRQLEDEEVSHRHRAVHTAFFREEVVEPFEEGFRKPDDSVSRQV